MNMEKRKKELKKLELALLIILVVIFLINIPFLINLYVGDIVRHYNYTADYNKAIILQKKLYKFDEKFLGPKNEYTIIALENLAHSELLYGNLDLAYKLYSESYDLRNNPQNKYLKTINPFVLSDFQYKKIETNNTLAILNFFINGFSNAENYFKESFKATQNIFGITNYSNLYPLANLLSLNIQMNNRINSEKYYKLILKNLGKDYLNRDKSGYYVTIESLAKYFTYINDNKNAELLYEKALSDENIKDDCGEKYFIYDALTIYYSKNKNFKKSNEYAITGLDAKIKKFGDKNNVTANGYLFAGYLLDKNGEKELARQKLKANLDVQSNLLYDKSPILVCGNYYLNNINKTPQNYKNIGEVYQYANTSAKNISIKSFCENYILGGN